MKKRDFLKTLPVWVAPVVLSVELPAHAQTSVPPEPTPRSIPPEEPPYEEPPCDGYDCEEEPPKPLCDVGFEWDAPTQRCVPCHPPNMSWCSDEPNKK